MTGNKNAPREQPRTKVAPEVGHYSPLHLPAGQAVDVLFNYVVHRWDSPPDDLSKKPAHPRFWLTHDEVGVSCALRAALFPVEPVYPLPRKYSTVSEYNQALIDWEQSDRAIAHTVEQFMEHVRDPMCWDFHHSIVWVLPDGGLSVTMSGDAQPSQPVVVDCPF